MVQNFRKKLDPNYKKKKRRIDPRDIAPEVRHQQEVDKQQAVQDADMKEGNYLQDPDTVDTSQPLQIHKDADDIIKEGITEDQKRYGKTDQLIREGKLDEAVKKHPDIVKDFYESIGAGGFDRQRQLGIDSAAQRVKSVTGSEIAGNIAGLTADILTPDSAEIGMIGAATAIGTPVIGAGTYGALSIQKGLKYVDDVMDFGKRFKYSIKHELGGLIGLVDASTNMAVDGKAGYYKTFLESRSIKGSKNPNQIELKLEPFMSNTYQRNTLTKMNDFGMGDGTFRMKAYNANKAKFSKTNKPREMLESYLSPDRLKGNFEGYKKFNKGTWEYKWGDFLKAKGYDLKQGIQAHHINPLFDSIHLFDNVKFNSKEYWSLMETLINKNARTGVIELTTQKGDEINNLMMTLGQAKDASTPHGIAHKFYNNFTPDFFSKSEMKKINTVPGYRKKKAKRWAALVNKSEEIILEAHKQWSLLNPETAKDIPFNELIERLSNLDARGYNKLFDPKYQLPDMNSIIKEIAADKGLKQIWQKAEPTEDIAKTAKWERHRKDVEIKKETKAIDKPKPVNPDQTELPGL